MILTVCLNPVIQKTLVFNSLAVGAVNRAIRAREDASGKGVNVSRVLVQAGAGRVAHLTQLGGERAAWFRERVTADGIDLRDVESGSPIRTCVTAVDLGSRESTELVEEGAPVTAGTEARVLDLYSALVAEASSAAGAVVVISGSKAPGFSADIFPEMTRLAALAGLRVVLDVRMDDLRSSAPLGAYVIKVNEDEFRATYAREGESTPDAIARVRRETGALVAVTAGPLPVVADGGDGPTEYPVPAVAAVNPIGSGDAFAAGLALALSRGANFAEAVREGIRLGSLNARTEAPGSILV